MKEFSYNVLKKKDEQDRDLQWEEQLSNGYQLQVTADSENETLTKLISQINERGFEKCDARLINDCLAIVSTLVPPIFINLSDYVMKYPNEGLVVEVPTELKSQIYCVSTILMDGDKLPIGWNICDTCGMIGRILTKNKRKSKILINEKTHITALDIRLHEAENIVVITPTIENLELN